MEWQEIEVDGRHTVKFTDLPYVPLSGPSQLPETSDFLIGKKLGGILRHGEWGWLAKNSVLQIVSLRSGQTISSYEFCESRGYESCCIKCVEEIFPKNPDIMLLAVVLESFRGPGGGCSYVAVYSVELSKVLHNIELSLHLTCASFLDASACRRSLLQNFDGCLAVGSEEGVIVLLDLNMRKLELLQNELNEDIFVSCHIIDYSLPLTEIHRNFRQCQQDGIHFGLQMEVIESPSSIQCILPIDLILGLAIGLEDGRLALYDLAELQIFCVAPPHPDVTMSALVKMDFIEPPDDPRPCLFLWTLHESGENLHAVLHSLMYEKRLVDKDESTIYFETFQNCSVRLLLPLEATKSKALACQAISSVSIHGVDDANCLCIITWLSELECKNKLLIFDLNQWYKEEMPFLLECGKQPNYLAGYILSGECNGLHTLVNHHNIAHFNSIQRFEEHFYPNSLSFETYLFHTEGCRRYNWEGAQNRVVNLLRSSNAAIFLEPNFYFNEIIRTRLMPQFIDMNWNSTFSRNAKYEILLSASLEHNCVSLLRDCAKSWLDGSFMGNFSSTTGLTLSTLTDWIWKRATSIKSRCNDLCKNLFEFGGYPLDSREQKELSFITRQLKLLAELLQDILVYAKKQIPERVFSDLAGKQNSLSMASSYQDILLWLLNIGFLPAASPHNDKINAGNDLIPYPYQDLKEFYKTKRSFYAKLNETFVSKKSGSCKLLFIDSFIEHVCKGNILHEYWLENEGNGLYPPTSLEAMLRVMLVPDLDYDNKCAILLYFFLDLNMAIDEVIYKDVVANFIKFPSVFKLSAALIKTVQAFWNLDHDHYLPAVDEFISPFNKTQNYPQWQVELLIEVLLNQKASNLALRILESQSSLISPLLKLNTLLANELLSEAFHFVRSKNDDTLLETFFTRCLRNGQFGIIRDLALSEAEGLILQNILKQIKTPGAESLHFVYLLQKSKYIEAVSYMEELSNSAKSFKAASNQTNQMDTPNLVLSAFNTTMTPVTQGLTDVYFRIKNKIKKKEIDNQSPVPLSCQLIKQNANNLLGGIYHSSALSAHFATYYWGEMIEQTQQTKYLLNSNNAPFLRKPQVDTNSRDCAIKNNICYPQAYKVTEKRTLIESGVLENDQDEIEKYKIDYKLNPKKKRRLIGQEIVEDLQHIMKTNKTLNAKEFSFVAEQQTKEIPNTTNTESFDLLLRPIDSKPKETAINTTAQTEIQGILKTHIDDNGRRDLLNEEEKNLRFRLPSPEASHTELQEAEIIEEELKSQQHEIVEPVDKIIEVQKEYSPKYKQITRTVSVDSCSDSSQSEEDFYSPLSSQNNSKLDTSNLSIASVLSGPQPRKPLARFSAEYSDKSLTPQPSINMGTEKTQYLTTLETNINTNISVRSSFEQNVANKETNSSEIKQCFTALETNINTKVSASSTNTEDIVSKETSNLAYVTAKETFSLPVASTSNKTHKQAEHPLHTTSSSQAALACSKTDDFVPKETSSKVGEPEKILVPFKISECSTVLGTLTGLESTDNTNNNPSTSNAIKPTNELNRLTDEQKRHMLETTLSMSDISVLETTSLQQTKSSFLKITTASATALKFEVNKETEIERKETVEESLFSEDEKKAEEQDNSPKKILNSTEESNDVFIVLSSSESSNNSHSSVLSDKELATDSDYDRDEYNDDDDDVEQDEEEEEEEETDNEDNIATSEDDYTEEDISCSENDENVYEYGMKDLENSNIEENVIQLIDDSSSELVQQINKNYITETESDSDSDEDINLIDDDISTDILEENKDIKESFSKDIELLDVEAEKKSSDSDKKQEVEVIVSNIPTEIEAVNTSITEVMEKEIITTADDKSVFLITTECEKVTSDSTENLEEIPIAIPTTSTTEVIAENKSQDLKQREAGDHSEEKRDEKLKDTESVKQENQIDDVKQLETAADAEKQEEKKDDIKHFAATENELPSDISKQMEENTTENDELINVKTRNVTESTATNEADEQPTLLPLRVDNAEMQEKKEIIFSIQEKAATITAKNIETNESLEESSLCLQVEDSEDGLQERRESNDSGKEIKTETLSEEIDKDSLKAQEPKQSSTEQATVSETPESAIETESKLSDEKEGQKNETVNETNIVAYKASSEEKADIKCEKKSESNNEKQKIEERKIEVVNEPKGIEEKTEKEIEPKTKLTEEVHQKMEVESDKESKILQTKHKASKRSSSVPRKDLEPLTSNADSTPRHSRLEIPISSQTIRELEENVDVTPRTRRTTRASSLQPKSKLEDIDKIQKTQDSAETETRAKRGSSVPSNAEEAKPTRRRSVLLESINEDGAPLDSPSTRTRLRSRLNSVESEVDSPLVSQKRTRKMSVSNTSHETLLTPKRTRRDSNNSETSASLTTPRTLKARSILTVQEEEENEAETSQTPKRKRHDSVTSHPETSASIGTPRSLRSKSVLSIQEENADAETITATPKRSSKKNESKLSKNLDETSNEEISPKSDSSNPISEAAYSSARRLTRTQLAVVAKSAALAKASSSTFSSIQEKDATTFSTQNKRPKSRSKRSSNATDDSDDAESISSKLSISSNTTDTKRVTRSSLKEKDNVDDDGASIASSLGSERRSKTRHLKGKPSPTSTLTTIPEDAPIESKKRGRPAKH